MKLSYQKISLITSVDQLRSVGPKSLARFQKLGIRTVRDLLWHIPVRYDDYSEISLINEVEPGKKINIQGQIVKMSSRRIFPRHLTIVNAVIKDSTGAI